MSWTGTTTTMQSYCERSWKTQSLIPMSWKILMSWRTTLSWMILMSCLSSQSLNWTTLSWNSLMSWMTLNWSFLRSWMILKSSMIQSLKTQSWTTPKSWNFLMSCLNFQSWNFQMSWIQKTSSSMIQRSWKTLSLNFLRSWKIPSWKIPSWKTPSSMIQRSLSFQTN